MLVHQKERESLFAEVHSAFRWDVLKGLGTKPRAIPARWLYDRRGSELFEAITALPEYYPTRTERSILSYAVSEIASLIGPKRAVVEFGSGSSTKTPILLSEVNPAAYVPIDISAEFLRVSVAALSAAFPDLPIFPIEGDFTGTLELPEAVDCAPGWVSSPGRRSETSWCPMRWIYCERWRRPWAPTRCCSSASIASKTQIFSSPPMMMPRA